MIKDAINFDILRLLRVEVSLPRQICQNQYSYCLESL